MVAWIKHRLLASGYVRDLLSRIGKTFAAGFLGQFSLVGLGVAPRGVVILSTVGRAAVAGGAAVWTLAFGALARWVSSDKTNAAFVGPTPGPINGAAPPAK